MTEPHDSVKKRPAAGFYPDHHDPNKYRFWDGQYWTAETRPAPAPTVTHRNTTNAYYVIARVMGVLAVSCIAVIALLIFTDVRVGGTNCGSVINSGSDSSVMSYGEAWICKAARDSRETWSFVALGGCVLFLVLGAVIGRAGDKVE
ncbi:DUF2510 domain-containing protein [Rhodococcus sp. MH15]|uniref:DUF2510 domain-containing protein n=1 Tax=Rhodococcus sp. MH15 TaxID=1761014 RepID=UPI001C4F89D2